MSTRPEGAKKVVLAVIDALDPDALEQAVEEDKAPVLARLMRDGHYVDDCVSTFPSVTPVAASAITTGLGPADHLIPSMNWYHRGEERYVEYGTSFGASRAARHPALAAGHRLQHEPRAPDPGAPDGLRAARRRGRAHRLHDLPDLPRPPPPRALERLALLAPGRGRAVPPRRMGRARAVLRRPVRHARDRVPVHAGDAGPARPPRGLRGRAPGGARPVRLPAALAARQRLLLAPARARRPARLDRGCRRRRCCG